MNTAVDAGFTDTLSGSFANLIFSDTSFTGKAFVNVGGRTQFSPNTNVDNPAAASPQNGGSWQSEFRYSGGGQSISLKTVAPLQGGDAVLPREGSGDGVRLLQQPQRGCLI